MLAATAPMAHADELTDQRDRVATQLSQTQAHRNESGAALSQATENLAASQQRLEAARAQLSRTQEALAAAKAKDAELAKKLAKTQSEVEAAKAAVSEAEKAVADEQAKVGDIVRTQYQQRTQLVGVGMLVSGESTGDISTRMQWSTTMFDSTQAEVNRLKETQKRLTEAKDKLVALEAQVKAEREDAAANLKAQKDLEAAARTQATEVANLVTANQNAKAAAEAQVAADEKALGDLNAERADVDKRIADRIAAQKAEAERIARENAARAVAERQAREAAAKARAAKDAADRASSNANQKKAAAAAPKPAPKAEAPAPVNATNSRASAHHGFIYPSEGEITSPFGMRLHPVLGIWKLHDGTDFAAGCGTPLRAPYDGVVTERYFNAGYGNRLMIDHGKVDGRYVTTGLNHAINYTVSPGQRVKQGQIVGYSGSTGYSTGCHLHFMVWLDGEVTNPMSWY